MLIAEKVKGISDTWDIIGGSPLLSIIPLDAQMNEYPGSLSYSDYGYTGYTQPAGGKFFDDLDNYAPETVIDHWAARAQAKKLDAQSIETRKVINRKNSYVVGRGLKLKPTPDHEIIGISLEEASTWGKNVGGRYHLWAKSKDSDVTGVNNLYQNQRFAHRMTKLLGEGFARFTYSDDPNLLNPLQIGFLDPNQIRGDELTFSSGPESQDDGLIKDKNGKTIGFKVWVTDPENPGRYKDETIPATDKKTGLPIMIHLYEPKNAGQTRGITDLLPAISDFEKITGYKTAALDRMKNGSSRDYVIENEQANPSDMDLNSLNAVSAGTMVKTETGSAATETPTTPWTYTTVQGGQLQTGVVISGGRQGDKLKASPDLSPGETSKDFVETVDNSICASLGMAPEVVDMKFGASFSASKGSLGLQDIEARIERDDLESDLEDPIYFAWLSGEIAAGRVQAPGWSNPIIRAAWLKKRMTADPPIILNPVQEATATEKNVAMARMDLGEAAENLNGSDFETNAANLAKQLDILPTDPFGMKEIEEQDTEFDDD